MGACQNGGSWPYAVSPLSCEYAPKAAAGELHNLKYWPFRGQSGVLASTPADYVPDNDQDDPRGRE